MVSFLTSGIVLKIQQGGSQTPSKHSLNATLEISRQVQLGPCSQILGDWKEGEVCCSCSSVWIPLFPTQPRSHPECFTTCLLPSQPDSEDIFGGHSSNTRERTVSFGNEVPILCSLNVIGKSFLIITFGNFVRQTGATQLSFSGHRQFMENAKDRTNANSDDRIPSHI